MKSVLLKIYNKANFWGFDALKFTTNLKGIRQYKKDLKTLKKQKLNDNSFPLGKRFPILTDLNSESGIMNGHYFHQDLYVARKIFKNKATKHVDIGSRTDGFVSHVAVFREIEIFDIREQKSKVAGITFKQADLMKLPANMQNYCDSLSSLHAVEHFGLGRYGDPIDYNGHLKAIENMTNLLKQGGTFYFSVPIGPQRIEFNAQRVFSLQYLIQLFETSFTLREFSYVDDSGDFFENIELTDDSIGTNLNCQYGCGIFVLEKK